jgi:CHAD domain-containing protein
MPQPVTVFLRQSLALRVAMAACLKKPLAKPVHKLRLSTRRLEATLELLALSTDLAIRRESKPLRRALRKVRRAAGSVRDLDVHRKLLRTCKKSDDTAHLDHDLVSARENAAIKLQDELAKSQKKISESLDDLETALKPVLDLELSGKDLIHLTRGWFAKNACQLDPKRDDELHSIRKAGKTARYIAETGAETSKATTALASRFERAQETLGAWHDYLLLLNEARASLPEQSPTVDQIRQSAIRLREQANSVAKHLLVTICAVPSQSGVH